MLKVSDVRLLLYVNRFTVYIPVLCIVCSTFRIILVLRICSEVKDNPPVDIHQRRDWKYMDIESRSSFLVSGVKGLIHQSGSVWTELVNWVEYIKSRLTLIFFFPRCTLWLGVKTINIDNKNASKQ